MVKTVKPAVLLRVLLPVLLPVLLLTTTLNAAPHDLQTVAERSGFTRTSLHADVVELVAEAGRRSDLIRVGRLTTSSEGREIPLVVLSRKGLATADEARLYGLPVVLLVGNIHGGEVEGKEALQMLLRDVVEGRLDEQLERMVVLVIPILNADGNDQLGDNRGDNGPELAGVRHNGQHLDLNRDFIKLETPEIRALVELLGRWQPVLFVDMHTTNGSYHREPVTYTTQTNPNGSDRLMQYMWQQLFPAVATTLLEQYGYDSLPYGNFASRTDPTKGWQNHAFAARYSTNYVGLRNILTVLDESYAHADFKTRVLASYGFVRSLLTYCHDHITEMAALVREERRHMAEGRLRSQGWVSDFTVTKLHEVTVKGYRLEIEPIPEDQLASYPPWFEGVLVTPSDEHRDYTVPYLSHAEATATIAVPAAYLIPAALPQVVGKLRAHGIIVEQLEQPLTTLVEQLQISKIETAALPEQGQVPLTIEGRYEQLELTMAAGSYLVSTGQPLARLIPVLLEPASEDSLVRRGMLNGWLVQQWSNHLNPYPVLRLATMPQVRRHLVD